MAASSIYRASTSPTRFQQPFASGPTHYTTTTVDTMHHMRYNSFAIDGHHASSSSSAMSSSPPTRNSYSNMMAGLAGMRPPPGATLGLFSNNNSNNNYTSKSSLYIPPPPQDQYMHVSSTTTTSSNSRTTMRHASPIYSAAPTPLFMNPMLAKSYQSQQQFMPTDVLLVSPGVPTPLELSMYEIKQPTGFLHVTAGNQTVEFLDGVANMPHKR